MTEQRNDTHFPELEADASLYATALQEEWLQVKVPVPFSLKWVNSYLIPEADGFTLVDPGLRTDEAIKVWDAVMQRQGLQWKKISRIVLTHQHPDHYGLAGYVQEKSGAPVYMTRKAHAYAVRLWGEGSDFSQQLQSLYEKHGMPIKEREAIAENLETFVSMVSPQPAVTYFEAGEQLMMGGLSWLLIDAPGHASGQLCFYQQERKWMLCGDQVLPHITPNVSIVPGEDGDPLEEFLQSLQALKQFEVSLAFPGHRDPFAGFNDRITELQQHHSRRLDKMAAMLAKEPRTAYGMCEALFGSRLNGNAHQLRFAMSETLAHLVHLERKARIASSAVSGICYFSAVKG
ncbi:MBL fold metallo-hydrolase [Paenibacillus sp. LHD-38]|uniref:MBL fold metallo-hydrolase n=1 Tax=Paenibacillus sp. LHD-38 TaxID=3072143 RepID=UPI00280DC76F|nr:MBL fold metallo-hydrolase [Paenibacillus sp. LHD-38]MDQ8738568.1 MBL fold metallo-hydrolase [Paenibacillus sp. LHD-38]